MDEELEFIYDSQWWWIVNKLVNREEGQRQRAEWINGAKWKPEVQDRNCNTLQMDAAGYPTGLVRMTTVSSLS